MICSLNVPKKFWKKWEILPFRRLPTASDTKWLQAYDIDQPVIFLRSEKPLYLVRHMYENAFLYQSIRSFQLACRARLVKKSATILKQQVESNAVETFANKHLVPCKDTIQSTTKKTLCSRCLLFKRFNFSRKHASHTRMLRESFVYNVFSLAYKIQFLIKLQIDTKKYQFWILKEYWNLSPINVLNTFCVTWILKLISAFAT